MAQAPKNPANGANLSYFILEGILVGKAGGSRFHLLALSGGGTGSTKNQPNFGGGFYPYLQGQKTTGSGANHQHGGPIPAGEYIIHGPQQNAHLGLSAYLEPAPGNSMLGRDGFYIHGRGPHGSDGCIVPLESFQELMTALQKDGTGTLFVEESTGAARFA
ncbi:MAG TPA: hypothetical protein VI756_19540 [Blastocatellia bacterium]